MPPFITKTRIRPVHQKPDNGATRPDYSALGDALNRAVVCGSEETARHLAEAAVRLLPQSPTLAESLVRYHLARNESAVALLILEGLPLRPAPLRLLRCIVLLRLGRRDEAHLDLIRWARQTSLPPEASALLALLEWGVHDEEASTDQLLKSLRQNEHPETLTLLMLRTENPEQATTWASRLRAIPHSSIDHDLESIILESVGQARRETRITETPRDIDRLARELIAGESLIPTLVRAQTLCFNQDDAILLANALEQALPELQNRFESCAALVRLLILLDHRASARRWLEWGLHDHPRSIELIRLQQELTAIDREDETVISRFASRNKSDRRNRGQAA